MSLGHDLPSDWRGLLGPALAAPSVPKLEEFLSRERRTETVYPPEAELFAAFTLCPLESVRVVILGQDPYHGPGQAQGLAFSVGPGVKIPPSLRNMLKERESDLGLPPPPTGDLRAWARSGVLLLNSVLSVRAGAANSHRRKGWEPFTDAVIRQLSGRDRPLVFLLWGNPARKKAALIGPKHRVIESPHPSPLSAYRGFFGSRPYTKANAALQELGHQPLDWRLPDPA